LFSWARAFSCLEESKKLLHFHEIAS
jgi:hypothetical protein